MGVRTIQEDEVLFVHFGATALAAQLLEQHVSLALFMRSNRDHVAGALDDRDGSAGIVSRESFDKQTLGKLVRSFQRAFELSEETATELSEALQLRNSLMHGYFPRNARRMNSEVGRAEMIDELKEHTETLWRATKIVSPFVSEEAEQVIHLMQKRAQIGKRTE